MDSTATYGAKVLEFNRWANVNRISANAYALYTKLLTVFNDAGWPDKVLLNDKALVHYSDADDVLHMRRIRSELTNNKLIIMVSRTHDGFNAIMLLTPGEYGS